MSTTEITVVGNVVTSPSRVRTQSGTVTNFRVASTERRWDGTAGSFVDGASFFVDVECWNELSGNVSHSVSKGDPVIVRGTLRTDEWENDTGRHSRPRVRARTVGFDLSKGTAEFRKTRRPAAAPPPAEPVDDAADERDYPEPVQPLYELDPDSSAAGAALDALPEPALR
ncbi:single-stranded DNA-binding protein [Geodermatophilus sp. SYSU D01062]